MLAFFLLYSRYAHSARGMAAVERHPDALGAKLRAFPISQDGGG